MIHDTPHCIHCDDKPWYMRSDSILVSLNENYPPDKRERFKLTLEGKSTTTETFFCQECGAWETIYDGAVVDKGYFRE